MAQADRSYLRSRGRHPRLLPRLAAQRRRLLAARQDGARAGPRCTTATSRSRSRRGCASRSSTASTPSTATTTWSGPSSSPTTSASAARATPRSSSAWRGPRPRRSRPPASTGPSRPASRSRATSAGGAPTRASARRPSSSRRWPRPRCAATSPRILACAKHYLADGGTAGGRDQGDAQMDEATLRAHPPARLPRGDRGRRRLGDGLLQQLERPEDARPPLPAHGRAEGRARLLRLRRLRLGGHRPAPRRLHLRRRDRGQRRHRHGDGPGALSRVRQPPSRASSSPGASRSSRIDDAVRRILAQEGRSSGSSTSPGPTGRSCRRSAPTPTGRSAARPCGSRWSS